MSSFDYPMGVGDYWDIVRRRKATFLVPFVIVVVMAVAVAFLLAPTYRSEATFLVQRQSVPQNMIATTVVGYVEEQIAQIRQRLVTRANLLEIARKFNLYQEELAQDMDGTIRSMREDVEVEMIDVRASDPNRRMSQQVTTIAFTVAFSAPTAEIARAATNELAERFLFEHGAKRDSQAEEVAMFLEEQASSLEAEIVEMEGQLASFRQKELNQLPELMGTNLRLFEKTEQDIDDSETGIRSLRDQISVTRAELSLTPVYAPVINAQGDRILVGSERLSALTAEYFAASSRYSSKHPDIIRLQREIRLLTEQLGGSDSDAKRMLADLVRLQDQLRDARLAYSDAHPEVQRLERAVSAVQRGFQLTVAEVVSQSGERTTTPDNPRYVALKTQLESSRRALAAEQEKLSDLRVRLDEYENRLFQTPAVERDFRAITRNYETALSQYGVLRNKQRDAELARKLESGEGGEKFVLTSSAYLPTSPDSPNRIGIGLLGVFLALVVAIVCVILAEHLDRTVRSARIVAANLGVAPLVVIPQISIMR